MVHGEERYRASAHKGEDLMTSFIQFPGDSRFREVMSQRLLHVCACLVLSSACNSPGADGTTVTPPLGAPGVVTIAPGSASLRVGDTLRLRVSVQNYPRDTTSYWSSLTPQVATVSQSGLVTGVSSGTAYIVAALKLDAGLSATSMLSVVP